MKSKLLIIWLILLTAAAAQAANTIERHGITWTFKRQLSADGAGYTYQTGTFANGDHYIVADPCVIITMIDPCSIIDGGRTINGSQTNPGIAMSQGYDSAAHAFSAAYNAGRPGSAIISASNPVILAASTSLISTDSMASSSGKTKVDKAAVLTVLTAAPAADSFRPTYCGSDKTVNFVKGDLNYNLLSNLTAVADTPALATIEGYFSKVWVDHKPGWAGDQIHPDDNMPDYGREIANNIGIGALMLNLDYTDNQKETLLVSYVQVGIDLYGVVAAGGEMNWFGNGGHGSGRKWPILFAGIMLDDATMKGIGDKSGDYLYDGDHGAGNEPADYFHFGEDDQTFFVKAADVYSQPYDVNYSPLSSQRGTQAGNVKITNGSTAVVGVGTAWITDLDGNPGKFGVDGDDQTYLVDGTGYTITSIDSETTLTLATAYTGATDQTETATYTISGHVYIGHGSDDEDSDWEEYVNSHLDLPDWGIKHSTIPKYDGLNWGTPYRSAETAVAWNGFVLAAHIMDAKTLWNHDALFDYQDRYMDVTAPGGSNPGWRSWSDFTENMWDEYREDYVPPPPPSETYLLMSYTGPTTWDLVNRGYSVGRWPTAGEVADESLNAGVGATFTGDAGSVDGWNLNDANDKLWVGDTTTGTRVAYGAASGVYKFQTIEYEAGVLLKLTGPAATTHFKCASSPTPIAGELDLSQLVNLTYIYVPSNSITTFDVSALTNVTLLLVNNNSLTELAISGLTSLVYLHMNNNSITSVAANAFDNLDVLAYVYWYDCSLSTAVVDQCIWDFFNDRVAKSAMSQLKLAGNNSPCTGTYQEPADHNNPASAAEAAWVLVNDDGWTVEVNYN